MIFHEFPIDHNKFKNHYSFNDLTYGAEHEWADWPLKTQLPKGYGRDLKDITIVNSNGIANDPKGKYYGFGGEINTPPTKSINNQVACLTKLKRLLPTATINYRSNLHLHIRIPGLIDDLQCLKQIQWYIHEHMPKCLKHIQPIPKPQRGVEEQVFEYEGRLRRWKRMRVSHQTLLTRSRLERQLSATNLQEFFNLEPPQSKSGKPLWHCQPRVCVNLRQLLETETIEFRHFAGTMDEKELKYCLNWCKDFLMAAIYNHPIELLLFKYEKEKFPTFCPYDHRLEIGYRATVHDGTNSKEDIISNIKSIKKGTFQW